jgi:hypothetical protein
MGGNSILAIQLSHRMSKELDCTIKVIDIFKFKSIDKILECAVVSKESDDEVEWSVR